MSTQLILISPQGTYRKAIELLTTHRLTGLPVVDGKGKLIGMLSEKDILQECGSLEKASAKFLDRPIRFRKAVRSAKLRAPLDEIARVLAGKSYRHIPIVDDRKILRGIITRRDLIRVLYIRAELSKKK